MRYFIVVVVSIMAVALSGDIYASDYFGSIQYKNPADNSIYLVFQTADSKSFCEKLNKSYIEGLRTTCPNCIIRFSGCDTALPSAFRGIFNDESMVLPYLSAPYTRIVVYGVEISKAIEICQDMALRWRRGMNQPARCILPP